MKAFKIIILIIIGALLPAGAGAQRKITPIRTQPSVSAPVQQNKPTSTEVDKSTLAEMRDAQGNVVYVDTITGKEWVDSAAIKADKKMQYPLWHSATVGVNVWDVAMRIFGQKYGLGSVWAELSLHNRYKPYFEFGMGDCNETPDGMNYTYKTSLSPYFKIGFNYNMLYNSNDRYQLLVGVRYGFTTFKWGIDDIKIENSYWQENETFSIPSHSATAGYFELCAGLRVDIVKNFSLGWMVSYHSIIHQSKSSYGKPMYIPGFGKRGNNFGGMFSLSYTFSLDKLNHNNQQSVNNTEIKTD